MKDNKLYVDSLPCKISWTTPLLLLCIVATLAAGVMLNICQPNDPETGVAGEFATIALAGNMFSAILWIVFFGLFANACRNLPHKISVITIFITITGSLASVAGCIASLYSSSEAGLVGVALGALCFVGLIMLGNALSNNYSSVLGEIGIALRKIVKILIAILIVSGITVLLALLTEFISPSGTSILGSVMVTGAIILGVCAIILGVWGMWVMFEDVIIPIYQMLNWGNQEEVTQNDIQNCVSSQKIN